MNFTLDNQLVKDYVLLINKQEMKFEEVPNLFNLRDVVQNVLDNQTNINNV